MTSTQVLTEKKKYKGETGKAWEERRALQVERDVMIAQVVDRLEVVNHTLLVALLGLDDTSSSRASIGRWMEKLAAAKEFQVVTQFDPLVGGNVTYAVTNEISVRQQDVRKQLPHKLLMSKFWACAELVLPVTERQTDRQLRTAGGLGSSGIVPDGLCTLDRRAYALECTRRDNLKDVVAKAQRYHEQNDYLKTLLDVEGITVLWVSKLPGRVEHMAKAFSTIGTGGMFRVCAEKDFTPFDPHTINSPIWMNPATKTKEVLYASESTAVDDTGESRVDAAHLF